MEPGIQHFAFAITRTTRSFIFCLQLLSFIKLYVYVIRIQRLIKMYLRCLWNNSILIHEIRSDIIYFISQLISCKLYIILKLKLLNLESRQGKYFVQWPTCSFKTSLNENRYCLLKWNQLDYSWQKCVHRCYCYSWNVTQGGGNRTRIGSAQCKRDGFFNQCIWIT